MEKSELEAAVAAIPYWYHRIELPYGITTPGWAPISVGAYHIPDNLTGKTVLDVGAWDGFWTFEAIKRGADHVYAVDDFSDTCGKITNADRDNEWQTFDLCADALGYRNKCTRIERGVEYISGHEGGRYDCIFLFGVLYHLQNPFKALRDLRELTRRGGTIHIETAILDNMKSAYSDKIYDGSEMVAEFYPGEEYGMNRSNWWVATIKCWASMVQAAGFKDIEYWKLTDKPKSLGECRGFIRATA